MKRTTLAALLAASLLGLGTAAANAQVNAVITVGPPAPIVETVPGPRPGYVWGGGHYEWRHGQYVWVGGRWIAERRGYEWREPRWVQRGNGEWVMVGGSWERAHWGHEYDRDYREHGRYWHRDDDRRG
jgi:hypothetical protein